jgi:thymidine phosphorylase
MAQFDAVELVRAKRDGLELSAEQIAWLVENYVAGTVPDEQVAALLMAIYWRGMSPRELGQL